jgi:hypothetical protein
VLPEFDRFQLGNGSPPPQNESDSPKPNDFVILSLFLKMHLNRHPKLFVSPNIDSPTKRSEGD